MPAPPLPPDLDALLARPNPAVIATLRRDGSPNSVATWYLWEGGRVLVNMDEGRMRLGHMRRDPRVALSIADKDNQYDKVDIRGRVVEWLEGDEAVHHIDDMAMKYMGQEKYPWLKPGEQRVVAVIEPAVVREGP